MKNETIINFDRLKQAYSGFTADKNGQIVDFKSGYAVALKGDTTLETALQQAQKADDLFIGYWKDSETGKEYWDCVQVVPTLETAIELGTARNEIAIWDFANGAEIRL